MIETATALLEMIENEPLKIEWMKKICLLSVEYLTLDGLEDAKRASDIPAEIISIIENLD